MDGLSLNGSSVRSGSGSTAMRLARQLHGTQITDCLIPPLSVRFGLSNGDIKRLALVMFCSMSALKLLRQSHVPELGRLCNM
jgi:hypothetical protein